MATISQAFQLMDEMNNNVKQVSDLVECLQQKVKSGEISTEHGLDFLEIKYQMLVDYLINLTFVALCKCSGSTIENDPSIDRLIEIRTVLEKTRPVDFKLRYQIDKLVKAAVTGDSQSHDPLSYKARPENLTPNGRVSSDSEIESDTEKRNKIQPNASYVPPKIAAVPYHLEKEEKTKTAIQRARSRMITSSMLEDLKEEYLDNPVEMSAGSKAQQMFSRAQKERENYEEAYLTRLPMTKVDKHRQRQLTTLGTLGDELTDFVNINKLRSGSEKKAKAGMKRRKSQSKKHSKKRKRVTL